ncbi:hypothetical protein BLNAU_1057 [Blattamonas nauphoetae]|uniref:protein-serine/threonine phosphatase n=1 Tax=Blattamonas nauphoetae TaxID=2049346 RepID=A0ABQ9YJP0_9EUKA|nr:hypothetical protein BLNAU_1057 [Blattamonas nauphoetae]
MRFPQHIFLIHGNHESSCLVGEVEVVRDSEGHYVKRYKLPNWNDFFFRKFPQPADVKHPFTKILCDLFKAMPSAVLCTLKHTTLQNEHQVVEERRVLCVHGGLSSIFPTPNLQQIIDHYLPIMDDFYTPSGFTTQQHEQWSRRTQHYSFNYAASMGDPSGADEPWEGRNRFSPITTRAFMAANRIDLIMRGHEYPMNSEGTTESHDGAIVTSFGAFDYYLTKDPPISGAIPDELGQRLDHQSFLLDNEARFESRNGAMQWLCLQSVTSNTVDPVVLVKNARRLAPSLVHSLKNEQNDTNTLKKRALIEHINTPTAGFTITADQSLARAATLPMVVETSDEMQIETEATPTSAILFTMKTIHLNSLAKILDSAPNSASTSF